MFSRYEIVPSNKGTGYYFTADNGDLYLTYFTDFTLIDSNLQEIPVVSFGFECNNRGNGPYQYDVKVKNTIVHVIKEFLKRQDDEAILYICVNKDGKERNRHITFGKWFNEMNDGFERYSSSAEQAESGFYSSIIFKSTNPRRLKLIEAFYFTISYYWGLGENYE